MEFDLDLFLCPATLILRVLLVCPTYWFLMVHFLHSRKFIDLQLECVAVLNDL